MADLELADLRKQCLTSLYVCSENICKYSGNKKEDYLSKVKSYIEQYASFDIQEEVANEAMERAKRETDATNIDDIDGKFEEHLKKLTGKTNKIKKHPYMTEFYKRINKFNLKSQENLDESDLTVTESVEQYLDPITKKQMVKPVRNKKCGHVYEKNSALQMIMKNPRFRCPVVGCGDKSPILPSDLEEDDELMLKMTMSQNTSIERSILDLDGTM